MVESELQKAYTQACYTVFDGTEEIRLRVGEPTPQLASRELGCWSLISACNPGSLRLTDADNAARDAKLREQLRSAGHRVLRASASAADGDWHEPGWFVCHIAEAAAVALARRFGQNALLCGHAGDVVRLVWCND